jgi:hypothetical protein
MGYRIIAVPLRGDAERRMGIHTDTLKEGNLVRDALNLIASTARRPSFRYELVEES